MCHEAEIISSNMQPITSACGQISFDEFIIIHKSNLYNHNTFPSEELICICETIVRRRLQNY